VSVDKPRDDLFVEVLRVQSTLAHLPAQVNKAGKYPISVDGAQPRSPRYPW
jgi:hypothetical protein